MRIDQSQVSRRIREQLRTIELRKAAFRGIDLAGSQYTPDDGVGINANGFLNLKGFPLLFIVDELPPHSMSPDAFKKVEEFNQSEVWIVPAINIRYLQSDNKVVFTVGSTGDPILIFIKRRRAIIFIEDVMRNNQPTLSESSMKISYKMANELSYGSSEPSIMWNELLSDPQGEYFDTIGYVEVEGYPVSTSSPITIYAHRGIDPIEPTDILEFRLRSVPERIISQLMP